MTYMVTKTRMLDGSPKTQVVSEAGRVWWFRGHLTRKAAIRKAELEPAAIQADEPAPMGLRFGK